MDNPALLSLEENWRDCKRCPLGERAISHVLYEKQPKTFVGRADVMLIGEGPGASEDALGRPFIGPAGALLRSAIRKAQYAVYGYPTLSLVYTNLIACRPTDPDSPMQNRPPAPGEIMACRPRLTSLIDIFQPRAIFCLGRVPERHLSDGKATSFLHLQRYMLPHPSYILRTASSDWKRSDTFQRYIEQISKCLQRLEESG